MGSKGIYSDVTSAVDQQGLDFLNIRGSARSIFADPSSADDNGKKAFIESDSDAQMMLYIPFANSVKLAGIRLVSAGEGAHRPKSLRLYTNRPNVLDFEEAEEMPTAQEVEVTWEGEKGTAELKFVSFQNLSSLVVFVVDAVEEGGEKTRIDELRLVGEVGMKRAMSKLEKVGDDE
ncbi:DUF1000-domain-containing protein [Piedraia hortae CBS 480.64]|uniref:DUF1000-domain-containing protein n=1 Tax=Piedraia hortae CBS 480.64 TaxID=1314780 RepID=A0A6A7BR73_9PEZI|nr:DUF1000-domain-containing protein [Piedraia hortae CBS 480.64]